MKNSSYYISPAGDRTHDIPHTVASNMVKVSHTLNHSATFVLQGSLVLGVYNLGAQCVGRPMLHMDVMRLVDQSKLSGETCYVGNFQHCASGVGAAGSCSVLCSGLAGPGDL